ncbi:CbiX/SirB N-terminal domain-containing protein [Tepidimonas sp.]|uniref:sirohydrochlorin chelatase n=1 Tax=Tepidimonas sp. TaxID=2002775 RepID=UPI0028CFBFB8|nr:CbiX/SirB N-terminal domain-containing protein [Tepidimonas sp.]MDT7929034.1 CbiX/SirB N-terminal domain-containing protein [Tepidimonas sp.]
MQPNTEPLRTTPGAPSAPGLIVLAHGARDPAWAAPFERVAALVRLARPQWAVTLAYLEFMAPDLLGAGAQMAAAGCRHVTILPAFLGAGGHVRKDVPRLLAELHARHPAVHWHLAAAVGEHPLLVQAMVEIALGHGTLSQTHQDGAIPPPAGAWGVKEHPV